MTKSALALAKTAFEVAKKAIPPYSHPNSPKKYTQHQLLTILVVRQFFGMDYRGTVQLFKDWSELRQVIHLEEVPHYSALCYAHKRLMGKKGLIASSIRLCA